MTWEVIPRDADLGRTLDPVTSWESLEVVERYNGPATAVISGEASDLAPLLTAGAGCLLMRDGVLAASGVWRALAGVWGESDDGTVTDTVTLGFVDDLWHLWTRLCYPSPAHALDTTSSTFPVSHDVRSGPRETILLGYIADNLGPSAPQGARRLPSLVIPASRGRGGSTSYRARMANLGDVVAELAEAGDLRVRVRHDETPTAALELTVTETRDLSDDIVFGDRHSIRATGAVSRVEWSLGMPTATRAVVMAAGEAEAREAAEFGDTAAESLWGVRVEKLVDQRQTDDADEIADAAAGALADGAGALSLKFDVVDSGDAIYRVTYDLGDKVGVALPRLPIPLPPQRVREVTTTVRPGEPEKRTVVVGTPGATTLDDQRTLIRALSRIAHLERSR